MYELCETEVFSFAIEQQQLVFAKPIHHYSFYRASYHPPHLTHHLLLSFRLPVHQIVPL